MKYSKQREVILATVRQNAVHPTADMVYSMVKQAHPNISLATIYRNLNLLAQNGLLTKIKVANGSDRFDGRIDEHYHMLCQKCGQVFDADVKLDFLPQFDRDILSQTGFTVISHHLLAEGICKNCSILHQERKRSEL